MRLQFDRFSRKLPIFTSSHMAIIFVKHDSIPLGSENGPTIIKSLTWFAYIRTWENIFSLSKMRRIFAKRKRLVGMETFSSLVCVCRNEGIVFCRTNDCLVHNYRVISKIMLRNYYQFLAWHIFWPQVAFVILKLLWNHSDFILNSTWIRPEFIPSYSEVRWRMAMKSQIESLFTVFVYIWWQ